MGSTPDLSRRAFLAKIGLASAGGVALAVAGGAIPGVALATPVQLPELEPTGRIVEYLPEPDDFALGTGWLITGVTLDWSAGLEEANYFGGNRTLMTYVRAPVRMRLEATFMGEDEQLQAFVGRLRSDHQFGRLR